MDGGRSPGTDGGEADSAGEGSRNEVDVKPELHAGGGAGGDVAVRGAQDDDEAVGHGNAVAGHIEFKFPFKSFGQFRGQVDGVRLDRARLKMLGNDAGGGVESHAMFPEEAEAQGRDGGGSQVIARAHMLQLVGTRQIVDEEAQMELSGEFGDDVVATVDDGAEAGIEALEIFEVIR